MYNRLISFIEKMDIIYAKKFGFRSYHSTEHAILNIVIVISHQLSEIIDNHIPLKQVRNKLSKPWITPAIRKSIIIKNKLHKT